MSTTSPPDRTPGSMLEIYMHALKNRTADDFLDEINLGVGYYEEEEEYWQQVQAFRNGLFADSAMTMKIVERAKDQTIRRIIDAIFEERADSNLLKGVRYPDKEDGQTKRQYYEEHAQDIWEDLGGRKDYTKEEHQAWLVETCADLPLDWTPPHWRMLKARHEASRSRDARLIDNLFGRPPEREQMQPMEDFQ